MRNKCLMLIVCGLQLIAAEKNRDWQTGQVVESKALTDARDHAIASADKTYLVRGAAGNSDEALAVGATVRFAVEEKAMFISLAGKEYKLYVLGVRASMSKPASPSPVAAVSSPPPAPATAVVAPPTKPAPKAPVTTPVPAPTPAAPPAPAPKAPVTAPVPAPTPAAPAPIAAAAPPPAPAPKAPVTAPVPAPTPAAPAPSAAAAPPPAPAPKASPPPAAPAAKAIEPPSEPPLDNDAVVKMLVGGLKEDTVVRVVEARPGKYTLTPDALAALKVAGVPQSVIAAMSAKMQAR